MTLTEKIEYHLNLAKLAQSEYHKQIAEVRRLRKEVEDGKGKN